MNTLTIFIRDCAVDLSVGVHPHEQERPQRIIVNVSMNVKADTKITSLTETVDYGVIRDFIVSTLPTQGHIPLLEHVAERILTACLANPRVLSATVRLEKPRIFPETQSVGVEITRTQTP